MTLLHKSLFSIPLYRKKQLSTHRKFIVFSSILFLLIFVLASVAFVLSMKQMRHDYVEHELKHVVEIEKNKLEAYINSEIALVRKMATSVLIKNYFLNPNNKEIAKIAFQDIEGYRRAFKSNSVFWVNDADKKLYMDGEYSYVVDPDDPAQYWYNKTMRETQTYNFNINYNSNLNVENLWINAPVFNRDHKVIGILGTGLNLSNFINTINERHFGPTELYLFNALGEITGARNAELATNKIFLNTELGQTGNDILAEVKKLKEGEIKYLQTHDGKGVAAFSRISALDWNITAIHHFSVKDTLNNNATFVFGLMMIIIIFIFVIINIVISILLEPLNKIVQELTQMSSELELNLQDEASQKGEFETLGDLMNMTIVDSLTGIYNRRFLDAYLKKNIRSLSRSGGKLSLLLVDIDHFKKYNDTYGHDKGDNCIKTVATVLLECITRNEDCVARYGGEEFVVVLPNTDKDGAGLIAEKILKKIHERNIPHEKSDVSAFVTVSIGGTTSIVKKSHTEIDFIKHADKALYKSKYGGRNRYTFIPF